MDDTARTAPIDRHTPVHVSDELAWEAPTIPTRTVLDYRMEEVRRVARSGNRELAYQLAEQVTQLMPDNVEAWLYRAALAKSTDGRFTYLNKALSLAPQDSQAHHGMYETLKSYLQHNPFLRYLEETDVMYRVLTAEGQAVIVPKERAIVTPYPPPQPPPLQPVYRWLIYSIFGLTLSGFLTLLCAPIAARYAWGIVNQPVTRGERKRALFAIAYAAVLWLIGLFLSFLLVLHLL